MERWEIEAKLNRDRAWLLETYAEMPPEELQRGVTASEHDPSSMWSALDHLVHLAGIEKNFNAMVRRYLAGESNPVGLLVGPTGQPRTREEIMATVHTMTEEWVLVHRGKSLNEVVALGQSIRADTLALIATLSDGQLGEKLPGAPWADGTIGAVLAVNADHGRMHWKWIKDGRAALASG